MLQLHITPSRIPHQEDANHMEIGFGGLPEPASQSSPTRLQQIQLHRINGIGFWVVPVCLAIRKEERRHVNAHKRHGFLTKRKRNDAVGWRRKAEHLEEINLGSVIHSRLQMQPKDICGMRRRKRKYRVRFPVRQEWRLWGEWRGSLSKRSSKRERS